MCGNTLKPLDMAQTLYLVAMWTVILFLSIAAAQAGQVTLAWNASSGATGYQVHYGTASGSYTNNANAGNTTTYTVANLADGKTYYFAVKAYDGAGNQSGFSNEVSTTLAAVAPAPVANFSANTTSGAAPLAVQFSNSSTNATAWSWNFGDGTSSTAQNPAKTYSSAGTYTVSLTATGSGGSHTATKTGYITVNPPAPVASFTASPDSGTAPLLVTFSCTSTGSITSRSWTFSDGTTDTAQKVVKTFNTGNHTATLKVTGSGGSTTVTKTISVTASAPVANFTASPTKGTAPLPVNFTDNSTGSITGWSWNFGDGTTSTAQHPAHTYQTAGTFTASLTVSGPGGTSSPKTTTITVDPSTTQSLPEPWQNRDIGGVGLAGGASHANGTFTLKGSGWDIWDTADAFHFAYQPLNGDGTIVARVASLTNTDSWAKAGVMIRENLDANARHAMVVVTPNYGVAFQRRTTTGGSSAHTAGTAKAPYWVKLTRAGNTFTAHQSVDGKAWTQIGSAVTISMTSSVYVGLALTSHNNGVLNTAILDNVSVTASNTEPSSPPTNSLQGWDIGNVGLAGNTSHANGTFTLKGSGADIWGTTDAFHFAYQPLTGDGSIVARVASLTNTDSWAKAGVMIRENLDANARHAMVVVTPGNGVSFQRRTKTGGSSAHTAGAAVKAPYWVKLTRSGNDFSAYQSVDGKTWVQVGSRITIGMGASVYVGLALTSHNNSALATATLDNVSVQ